MINEKLYNLTATEIVKAIKMSELTALEVSQSFIQRSKLLNPVISAWAAYCPEYIEAQAVKIDQLPKSGLLAGVSIGIKDIFNTEYYPAQKGTPVWSNYKAGNDARCVSYLRNEGVIIFGKTDTAELAVHAGGKARNPHSLDRVTGSSSGGSAAAVATGMVPISLGSQTGGSTIRPASWCGVYGMKPSFGFIPRTGVLKTTDTLDTIGFFGRSVYDLELLLDVLRIRGDNFPIQEREVKKHAALLKNKKKWRIAFCESHFWNDTQPYVKEAIQSLKEKFSILKEIEIVELKLPKSTESSSDLHRRIYHPCLAYYLKNELKKAPDQISDVLLSIFEDAKTIPPTDYGKALQEQSALASEMEQFFAENRIDCILTNSSNGSAPYEEPSKHQDLNPLWTMSWLPVINIPQFKCEKGLPFGFQVVGSRYSDYNLLALLKCLDKHGLIPHKSEIIDVPMRIEANDNKVVYS